MFRKSRARPRPGTTTALILAGGRAERFGTPKPLAMLGGEPLLLWVARSAAAAAGRIVVAIPEGADPTPYRAALGGLDRDGAPPLVFLADESPYGGPVAGVSSALVAVRDPFVLLLAADMPLVPPDLLLGLAERLAGHDTVLFHLGGWWQTLPALWRRRSLDEALDHAQATGGRSLHSLVEAVDARPLGPEYYALFGDDPMPLVSIDTRDDLAGAEAWLTARRATAPADPGAGREEGR